MLTKRGADQVCTSLRAARKSLADGGVTPVPRIKELDLMIEELTVGTTSFRGDAARSRAHIEALVSALTPASRDAGASSGVVRDGGASDGEPDKSGLHDALGHFRRAEATLRRLSSTPDESAP